MSDGELSSTCNTLEQETPLESLRAAHPVDEKFELYDQISSGILV